MSKTKEKKEVLSGLNNTGVDNLYKNFILIRQKISNELSNKVNPKTKEKYTDLEILEIADTKFNKYKTTNLLKKNFAPVGIREGKQIFQEYYVEKYGKELGEKKMKSDKKRSTKKVIKPNSSSSYLYRPIKGKPKRGPEALDMAGVDDGIKKKKK